MNILYIAHRIPYPPNKGEKIRAFHQIRHLSRNNRVHLACIVDDRRDVAHVDPLGEWCASVDYVFRSRARTHLLAGTSVFGRRPLSVGGFYSRELQRQINARIRSARIDRIVVYSSQVAEYAREIEDIPRVIDFVDVDSDKWRLYAEHRPFPLSWVFALESQRLGRYEEEIASSFDHSILVTEREARLLRERVVGRPITVISNGVDLEKLRPTTFGRSPSEPILVFTGVMDYYPNVDAVQYFCSEIFPLILRQRPTTRFFIVGRNPTRAVERLGREPNVEVTGEVADVDPYLSKASLAVVPLRISRGVQNKILEAMAKGLPVITTSEAVAGTEATTTDGVRVADDPAAFAARTLELLGDDGMRRDCALRARRYVERCHDWDRQGAALEALIRGAGGDRPESPRPAVPAARNP